MDIKPRLAFVDHRGNEIPTAVFSDLNPNEFYHRWAKGDFRRQLFVDPTRPDYIKDLQTRIRQAGAQGFGLYFVDLHEAITQLRSDLCIAEKILELDRPEFGSIQPQELPEGDTFYYTTSSDGATRTAYRTPKKTYYPFTYLLASTIVYEMDQWAQADVMKMTVTILRQLVVDLVTKDNISLVNLFVEAALDEIAIPSTPFPRVASLSEAVKRFEELHGTKASVIVTYPEALSRCGVEKEEDWCPSVKLKKVLIGEDSRLGDIRIFCMGNHYDFTFAFPTNNLRPDFIVCADYSRLGVRTTSVDLIGNMVDKRSYGVPEAGWLFYTYIGTMCRGPKVVQAYTLETT